MSSTHSEHDCTQDAPAEDSVLNSFNLFLSLMTAVEFARLLRSRVKHLLRTWPPASASDDIPGYHKIDLLSNRPLPPSLESIRLFTSFFRMQDHSAPSESGANLAPSSLNDIQQHLLALETLLSCVSPKELQHLIQSRLKEGSRDRTAAIRGLLDIMRSAAYDEAPENPSYQENSSFNINFRSDSDIGNNEASSTTVSLSPGTTPIPRVTSPGTRDQSTDADDSIILESSDPQKLHPFSRTKSRSSLIPSRTSSSLFSPTISTSQISSSTVTTPMEHTNMRDILESQMIRHTSSESSSDKKKESVLKSPTSHSTDLKFNPSPYPKLPRSSRRKRSLTISEPSSSQTSQTWFQLRIPENPRRKSERLSVRNQPTSQFKGTVSFSEQLQQEVTILSSSLTDAKPPSASPVVPAPPTTSNPAGASGLDRAPAFGYTRADGRESPPGPVLRAVDWSNPVRSASTDSDDDDEDAMEEEQEEELDELADDISDADSRISEFIEGWNSHLADPESENAAQPSSQMDPTSINAVSTSPTNLKDEVKELASEKTVFTSSDAHSPRLQQPDPSTVVEPDLVTGKKKEPDDVTLPTNHQDHSMSVDLPVQLRPGISPAASTVPEISFPSQLPPPPQQLPMHPPYYPNSHHLSGQNPYSLPVRPPHPPDLHRQISPAHEVPHSSQPSLHHPFPHVSNVPPPSYHPPPPPHHHHSHNLHPYPSPIPPPSGHPFNYHSLPPSLPSHMPAYPPQQPVYTSSPWYGNSYFHQTPPPSRPPYPSPHPSVSPYSHQQASLSVQPTQDQHLPPQIPPSHSQPYAPSNYLTGPSQSSPLQFLTTHGPQIQYAPPQDQYPPNPQGHYPSHTSSNPYHPPPPSFPPSGPPETQSSSSFVQQQHAPIHLQKSTDSAPMGIAIPKPPSPIIPPPSGPRPPPPLIPLPLPPPRSPSPPVKPPEAPKRFFSGRRSDGEGDVNFFATKDFDDPNVRYTDEVGIKETPVIRRRCHNCRSAEAPSWRKSKLYVGKILCNKCGIYESTHMMARPLKTRPRRLLLNGERDYHFEMFKNSSPVTPSGSPTSSSTKRRRRRRESPTSDNDDEFDLDD